MKECPGKVATIYSQVGRLKPIKLFMLFGIAAFLCGCGKEETVKKKTYKTSGMYSAIDNYLSKHCTDFRDGRRSSKDDLKAIDSLCRKIKGSSKLDRWAKITLWNTLKARKSNKDFCLYRKQLLSCLEKISHKNEASPTDEGLLAEFHVCMCLYDWAVARKEKLEFELEKSEARLNVLKEDGVYEIGWEISSEDEVFKSMDVEQKSKTHHYSKNRLGEIERRYNVYLNSDVKYQAKLHDREFRNLTSYDYEKLKKKYGSKLEGGLTGRPTYQNVSAIKLAKFQRENKLYLKKSKSLRSTRDKLRNILDSINSIKEKAEGKIKSFEFAEGALSVQTQEKSLWDKLWNMLNFWE